MQKVAILGASGFIGSPLADAFEVKGWEVVAFTHRRTEKPKRQEYLVDLFDEASLKAGLSNSKPDLVVTTAWDTEHGKFWTKSSNLTYRDATLSFAELSFKLGIGNFIGLGTMSEYGKSPGYCNAESSLLVADDLYSKSKIETGIELERIGNKFGCRTHWARIFQAFGPNEKPERFIPGILRKLQNYEKFSIRTPNYEMDWIHTADIASALIFTIENRLNHFVDIGTGVGTTVRQLSELICSEFKLDPSLLDYSEQIFDQDRKAIVSPETQLLSRGWKPAESLRSRIHSLG
jgi:nucleoside-diphosphate-sugar epimerase